MKTPLTFLQGIVITIVAPFILLIIFIIFSNKNSFGLVEKDYYQKAINYQEQIERKTGANQLSQQVEINVNGELLFLLFPSIFQPGEISGDIILFRPSDPDLDFNVPINLNNSGIQTISTFDLQRGAWIVQVYWSNINDKYYSEQRIFIEN